jgi:hypothetical protein
LLLWIRQVIDQAAQGKDSMRKLKLYPGTRLARNTQPTMFVLEAPGQPTPFMSLGFLSGSEREENKASILLTLNLDAAPNHMPVDESGTKVELLQKHASIEISKCNAVLSQGIFPPRSQSIVTRKAPDQLGRSYEWATKDGWLVTVSPGNVISLRKVYPEVRSPDQGEDRRDQESSRGLPAIPEDKAKERPRELTQAEAQRPGPTADKEPATLPAVGAVPLVSVLF